jgi:hypothetical protein
MLGGVGKSEGHGSGSGLHIREIRLNDVDSRLKFIFRQGQTLGVRVRPFGVLF